MIHLKKTKVLSPCKGLIIFKKNNEGLEIPYNTE